MYQSTSILRIFGYIITTVLYAQRMKRQNTLQCYVPYADDCSRTLLLTTSYDNAHVFIGGWYFLREQNFAQEYTSHRGFWEKGIISKSTNKKYVYYALLCCFPSMLISYKLWMIRKLVQTEVYNLKIFFRAIGYRHNTISTIHITKYVP